VRRLLGDLGLFHRRKPASSRLDLRPQGTGRGCKENPEQAHNRHSGESRNPVKSSTWTPASAGVTTCSGLPENAKTATSTRRNDEPCRRPAWVAPSLPILAVLALAALSAAPAVAKEGDTLRPFVSASSVYDSNLFRLAEGENPGTRRAETFYVLNGGANLDWKIGRQQVSGNFTQTAIRYDRNTFLDFDGSDARLAWNWRLGNRLSGNAGASESKSQSSFDNLGIVNNKVDRSRRFARAEWTFHPRWRVGVGVETAENNNSALSQRPQDFEQDTYNADLTYLTPKGSSLGLRLRTLDAKFPNRQTLLFLSDKYTQNEYGLTGVWRHSAKLTARVQASFTERNNDSFPQRDFDGFTGRASADWFATGKTLLSLAAYRELGSADDINATFVLRHGGSLNGTWLPRDKWRVNAGLTYENRNFKGDPGTNFIFGQSRRKDDTYGASLSVSFTPHPAVTIALGGNAGRRDSDIDDEDYRFHSVFANVRADF